jgi:hypothetical protein
VSAPEPPPAAQSREKIFFEGLKANMIAVMSGELPPPARLTAQDRCDRCGAQAYVRTEPLPGLELLFCRHDYRVHTEALASSVTADETSELDPKP